MIVLTPANISIGLLGKRNMRALGGTAPYTYSVRSGGGSIDASGQFTAPAKECVTTVRVTDSTGAFAETKIFCCTAIQLVCDILAAELGLARERVYLWNQKLFQPKDDGLYIAVGVTTCKPFANRTAFQDGIEYQSTNFVSLLDINLMSRGPDARDRKEEVIMALASTYSQQQQEANALRIAKITTSFANLSSEDGAGIPYRFIVSVNVQYVVSKQKTIPYFDSFAPPTTLIDP